MGIFDPGPRKSFERKPRWSYEPPGWQVCPICEGKGNIQNDTVTTGSPITKECPTCKGKRIISKLNGKPPTD